LGTVDKSRELSGAACSPIFKETKMNKEIKKSEWVAAFFITAVVCAIVLYIKNVEVLI